MTQIDGPTRRRLINWSLRPQSNRIVFALIVGWIAWLALGRPSEWLGLVVAVPAYVALTLFFVWRDYPGTERNE